ncbi:MAG: hypothetical protein OXK77_06195 [Gemmatimonadota bacterium]|nr:hypothetical protein [Gemmatimonadota bacterium]MDE2865980.1 hypothetical protein [Gemmatimonadota bacterium]
MTRRRGRKTRSASVEGLPADWRKRAKVIRRYGGDTPATAIERCAEDLEATLVERDGTTYSLVEASRESGYSADHLGRLVRDGKITNAGRPGAPRIARRDLPRKAHAPVEPPSRFQYGDEPGRGGVRARAAHPEEAV